MPTGIHTVDLDSRLLSRLKIEVDTIEVGDIVFLSSFIFIPDRRVP